MININKEAMITDLIYQELLNAPASEVVKVFNTCRPVFNTEYPYFHIYNFEEEFDKMLSHKTPTELLGVIGESFFHCESRDWFAVNDDTGEIMVFSDDDLFIDGVFINKLASDIYAHARYLLSLDDARQLLAGILF